MVIILIKHFKKIFSSLRWILFVTYLFVGLAPLLLFAGTISNSVSNYFYGEREKELLSQANIVSGNISVANYIFDDTKEQLFDTFLIKNSQDEEYRIIVVDAYGTVINDSNKTGNPEDSIIGKTYLLPEIIGALDSKNVIKRQPGDVIYAAVPISDSNGKCIGAVLISASSADIAMTLSDIEKQIWYMLVAIMAFVGILILFLSQIFIEPLKKVLSVIQEMSEGHLDKRVPIGNSIHNEITNLAIACNAMADKLEKVEVSRQQFVSNVSHELKTPLSSIKVLSESVLLDPDAPKETYIEFLEDINSEVDRMTAIINDLLTLVKVDQRDVPFNFTPEDINKMISDIVKRLKPLADEKEIELNVDNVKDVTADVDLMKISLAISNIIENAIKYTPEKGTVKIIVDCDHQNAFFTISDTGIGIAEEELNKIFERFYRIDKNRDRQTGGTGLGLSITHSTVLMHKGSIKVSSKENEGTTFLVRIPLKQSSNA